MPSPDDHDRTTPRAARRSLGRGPGTSSSPGAGLPGREPGPVEERPGEPEPQAAGEPVPAPPAGPEQQLAPGPGTVPAPAPASPEPELPEPMPEPMAEPRPAAEAGREPELAEERPESGTATVTEFLGETGAGAATPPGADPRPHEPDEQPESLERAEPAEPDERRDQEEDQPDDGRFKVVLDNFEGPFDLLLQLISKHKLDVTEVALSKVTDEFMAYIHAMGPDWDLDQTTEFLVVASTLLDLKAARLLPAAEVEDEADLALLEARDLLFARLLQYRAYKEIAGIFAGRMAQEAHRHPRTVGLEPHHAELLPEVAISIGPEGFARLAVKAMQPKPKPQVYVEHIHAPLVSVREQAEVVVALLRELGEVSFQRLTQDAPDTLTVVARFLALLELFRERAVSLEQEEALGALTVRWSGEEGKEPLVTDEFDQEPGQQDEKQQPPRESASEEEIQP
ncbi:segregation/condensation protein A [Streptomyces sp. WMMB 322]|uniref:segregation/condensation protein A n=1 Tax=Streptomyces sp. WMMB 322 TaxID=1286821 RepID=UPI0006E31F98|nr:segregation/condensation protein A [Streptomyces sp. WMMB 322]SCK53018.1 condensin subunit ScpA [Streptomyces sp. WMMB 322]